MSTATVTELLTAAQGMPSKPLHLHPQWTLQVMAEAPDTPGMFRRSLSQDLDTRARRALTVEQVMGAPTLAPAWVAALVALGAEVSLAEAPQGM